MQTTDGQIEVYTRFFHGLSNPARYKNILSLVNGEMNEGELAQDIGCS
ncbi:MAG: hypothetical protein PHC65_06535 [Methanobacteriaceae archaeon]|nr:hypothetical protein [Terrisporobacter sp.]MDD2644322.1 hypothetical protein [Methanobacteriaceae archaeon]MDD4714831.1 hypothetical protein [Candidatus Absconditabacteria bacterium]